MGESDYRPGPWYVRDFRESTMSKLGWTGPSIDSILIVNKTGAEIIESAGESCVVARIQFDNRRPDRLGDNNYADACLIAAAPDMLEALRRCAAILPQYHMMGKTLSDDEVHSQVCEDVQAAISKATGAASPIARAEP